MSSTYGFQPTFSGEENYGINTTPYQIGQNGGSWPGGSIQNVNVYFGGWQNTVGAKLCIWNASGTLLWASDYLIVPQGTTGIGGQDWVTVSPSGLVIAADASGIVIGCWREPSGRFAFSRDGTSTHLTGTNTIAGNITGSSSSTGRLGAYVTYNQGGLKTYDGSAFHKHPLKQWNGSAWKWRPLKEWDGSAWKRRA